jgi:hypothetical protein
MTTRDDADKPAGPTDGRHIYGPRPVGALLPALVRPAFRKRSPATAQLLLDWDVIIGPAIAAVTAPRKLFSGTLSIVASGPIAMELQHLSSALIERINTHLGRVAVTRLRFVQDATTPRPPPVRLPNAGGDAAAREAVATLPAGPLREALEGLGRAVLAPAAPIRR